MSGAQSLTELKAYFKTNAVLNTMNKTARGITKCVMCLSNRNSAADTKCGSCCAGTFSRSTISTTSESAWGASSISRTRASSASMCGRGAPRVVIFYIEPLLQTLANDWFHPRPAHRYRLEDALDILHSPQPADNVFLNQAYNT